MSWLLLGLLSAACAKPVALPHYTPKIQLHRTYLERIARVIRRIPRAKLLVWGVGYDSKLWCALNRTGTTIILEDDPVWGQRIGRQIPCRVAMLRYGTRLTEASTLIGHPDRLQLDLPADLRQMRFDVILIDAPNGSRPTGPGRMKSIYMSTLLSHRGTHIFLHDYQRPVERQYADRYLTPLFGKPAVYRRGASLAHFSRNR